MRKPSAQIPKAFNQHDAAGKTIKYVGINTLLDVTNGSPKHVSCMGRGVSQGHNNKISRACQIFIINRTELKFKYQ